MNILITGSNGFIGKNLIATLQNLRDKKDKTRGINIEELYLFDTDTPPSLLDEYCQKANFVFNLAGVNRPKDPEDFMTGNFGFSSFLLNTLKKHKNPAPVVLSSSIQAAMENPYGQSKKAGEDLFFQYAKESGVKVLIYRFPNVFGKWCRPNYNSVVATFCHNVANGLPITVSDRSILMNLVYIDDVIQELVEAILGKGHKNFELFRDDGQAFYLVPTVFKVSLGEIVDLIYSFKAGREDLSVPNMGDPFTKKLYATYLSYLPKNGFGYDLKTKFDQRGSFSEIIRTSDRGQFSVNICKPGVTKGQHWHHTKNEKFLVVSGTGVIRFRSAMPEGPKEIIEYFVSGDQLKVIDIPTGYTHNIENLGSKDLVTFMWCCENFDPNNPDTYFLEV